MHALNGSLLALESRVCEEIDARWSRVISALHYVYCSLCVKRWGVKPYQGMSGSHISPPSPPTLLQEYGESHRTVETGEYWPIPDQIFAAYSGGHLRTQKHMHATERYISDMGGERRHPEHKTVALTLRSGTWKRLREWPGR